jgi:hypothetical protein
MQSVPFVAKYAFQGDVGQAQLSFVAGSTIVAKPMQEGAWWWGSLNGKEGWFPPSYVTPAAPLHQAAPPVQQQRMQQVAFSPANQRMGPVNPSAVAFNPAPSFAGHPHQQQAPQAAPRPQMMYVPSDPFAGLPTMDNGAASSLGTAAPMPSFGAPPTSTPAATLPRGTSATPFQQVQPKLTIATNAPAPTISTTLDPTTAAFARMGIAPVKSPSASKVSSPAPSQTNTPAGSRPASPLVPAAATVRRGPSPVPPPSVFGTVTSQEETQARIRREQEEARTKAQLRKEQEELKAKKAVTTAEGLGTSGSAIVSSDSQVPAAPASVAFNPYNFLVGGEKRPDRKFSPIFRVPPFWALLNLNTYIHQKPVPPELLADRTRMYEQLSKALSFVSHVCEQTRNSGARRNPLAFLDSNHMACEAAIKLISLLPHSAGASGAALDGLFINFINVFLSLMENVQVNQQLVLPGGWQQPDYTYLCLYIIRNCGNNRWSFSVCNTGRDGLQYHPATFDPETGNELKQLAMTIWDIPASRVLDSTFWTILFRMQVYPSRKNNAAFLYTKLLPALNSRPVLSNLDQGPAEYLEVPDVISAQSYHPLARIALTTTPATGMRGAKYASLLLMNAAVQLAYDEIEKMPPASMDPEDTRILKLTGRNLANCASTISPNSVGDGSLGATLSETWELLDKLLIKVNVSSSRPMDQYSHGLSAAATTDDFAKGKIVSLKTGAGSAAHPLFGRLRRDNYEEVVKRLMGDPRQDPILIPPVLTDEELPPTATDYATASSYLQRIADACSLLLQQRRLIKNSPAFAASAAQHALTIVLPMPNADPRFCFWRKGKMRRETQLNLLFLIRRLCRIYSAATACVQQSRGLIAIRSTAFACAACVSDAICRVVAIDDPSAFALHYSGLCEGPTEPFAIEAGAFDTLGSNLPIYDPNMCSLRFQCLDYLKNLTTKMDGSLRHTIFNFDKSLSPTKGDTVLIDQLSIQLALQRPYPMTEQAMMTHSASLIGGRNGSLIEVLPEFEYFRDIVFHFKHAVSGTAATPEVADTHTWLPSDATLHWAVRRNEKEKDDPTLFYHVRAFGGHNQLFVERIAQQEPKSKKNGFKGFLSLFSGKTRIERSRLSSADANTVVNSCGEKFLNKR